MLCREERSKTEKCFAYRDKECICLQDTFFKDGSCPFYKSMSRYKEELVKFRRK